MQSTKQSFIFTQSLLNFKIYGRQFQNPWHTSYQSSLLGSHRIEKLLSAYAWFSIALDSPQIFAFAVGAVFIVFKQADANSKFDPMTIGTDHIAMVCESEEELQRAATALAEAGVENTGVKLDATLQKKYVAFKDPDRIQWEFYMA